MTHSIRRSQRGAVLIEAMVASLLFVIGIVGLVGALGRTISNEADSEYRNQATKLASEMMNTIWLGVSRAGGDAGVAASLNTFSHQANTDAYCSFSGAASGNAVVTDWVKAMTDGQLNDISARLPGASTAMQQIVVDTAQNNQVTITLCWQSSLDTTPRQYVLRSFIN